MDDPNDNNERRRQRDDGDEDRKPPAKEILCSRTLVVATTPDTSAANSVSTGSSAVDDSVVSNAPAAALTVARTAPPRLNTVTNNNSGGEALETINENDFDPSIGRDLLFRRQVMLLSGTSILSMAVFVYAILPFAALVALMVCAASSGALLYGAYRRGVEYGALISDDGLREWLPEGLYRALTEQTLHEYMTDETFGLENRYLLLYFIPGVSPERLEGYVDRLAPRHREIVRRRGLGYLFLGDDIMRAIVGNRRWNDERQAATTAANGTESADTAAAAAAEEVQPEDDRGNAVVVPATSAPRVAAAAPGVVIGPSRNLLLEYDDSSDGGESDLGLEITGDDLAGRLNDRQASSVAQSLGLIAAPQPQSPVGTCSSTAGQQQPQPTTPPTRPTTNDDDDDDDTSSSNADGNLQDDYDREEQVLTDAIMDAYNWVVDPVYQYATDAAVSVLRPVTGTLAAMGLGVSVLSGGIGIWGYCWRVGAFATTTTPRGGGTSRGGGFLPSSSRSTLWTAALLGGASAGVMLFARSMLLSQQQQPNSGTTDDDSPSSSSSTGAARPEQQSAPKGQNGKQKK